MGVRCVPHQYRMFSVLMGYHTYLRTQPYTHVRRLHALHACVTFVFSLIYVFSALHRPACDLEINLSMPC